MVGASSNGAEVRGKSGGLLWGEAFKGLFTYLFYAIGMIWLPPVSLLILIAIPFAFIQDLRGK